MTSNTKTALTAILAADGTIPAELAGFALKMLGMGGTLSPEDSAAILKRMQGKGGGELDRVIRTTEAARLCGVTTKTLRNWCAAGVLVPVYGPGKKLRAGYTAESVRALIAGRSAAKPCAEAAAM